MTHDEAIVRTENLTKTYDDVDVVGRLDLAVPRHSIFGFLGPSGAGKTTTMKMLLGLIRPTAVQGPSSASTSSVTAREFGPGWGIRRRTLGSTRT